MFTNSAQFYDLIYSFKDYNAESNLIGKLIHGRGRPRGSSVLDVACGTGLHAGHLAWEGFVVEGLELDERLLALARERNPGMVFHHADMVEFDLGRRFDAVVCLFSSIGYVKTLSRLNKTLATFSRHVEPGGVVLVEPWITLEDFHVGQVDSRYVDQPDLKLVRMHLSRIEPGSENPISPLDFQYQMVTPEGVTRFEERHDLGLFTHDQYQAAFISAGLSPEYDPMGPMGRGIWIGTAG